MFMRHNSKLSSLSKAIITLDSNSKDLQKYAGIVSLLAAAGKFGLHLATPVITGAIGGKLLGAGGGGFFIFYVPQSNREKVARAITKQNPDCKIYDFKFVEQGSSIVSNC